MAIRTENLEVVGLIHFDNGQFELLSEEPLIHTVPWWMRDGSVNAFYVIGTDGYAKNVYVKGNFVIEPLVIRYTKDVKFLIEEVIEQEHNVESSVE